MTNLYPLKFKPIRKERLWGEESWTLSGLIEDESVVLNGFLADNNINELIEVYLGDLLGEKIYERFGEEFPVLIKFIDVNEHISLQMHPDDKTAMERHNSYGKIENWYIISAEPSAKIYLGLNRDMTPHELYDRCCNGTVEECLNVIVPQKGDIITIESCMLHSATGGFRFVEVQQTSDLTYRIYDWGRENDTATARELHFDLAIDCINYERVYPERFISKAEVGNSWYSVKVITGKHIGERCHHTDRHGGRDEAIIYVCTEGSALIRWQNSSEPLKAGETVLIPADLEEFCIEGDCTLLEVSLRIPE